MFGERGGKREGLSGNFIFLKQEEGSLDNFLRGGKRGLTKHSPEGWDSSGLPIFYFRGIKGVLRLGIRLL